MNTKHSKIALAVLAAALAPATLAHADEEEHVDVWVDLGPNGGLVIGGVNEELTEFTPGQRVFGAEFGEDPALPFFADEPGFQALDGTFDPGFLLQVNLEGALGAWNGNGFDDAAGHSMTVSFGPASVTTGGGPIAGFDFAADDLGGFHDHFDLDINGESGDPADDIYLLPMSLAFADGSNESETFWFVMNLGMDEVMHEAAIEWVELNLVPAPGVLALAGLAGLAGTRRRRA